jgi:linoleoyl-CoA desaturase
VDYKSVKFNKTQDLEFFNILQRRVRKYFKENNISKFANYKMVIKTVFMLALYLVPYFLVVLNVFDSAWQVISMYVVMGLGMSGIGLSVMHDANHGSYSKNKNVNKYLGYVMNFLGGSSLTWKIQHNVLHHSFTNITGIDEDIDPGKLMRFSPHDKHYKLHKYQHIYAWVLYSLMTISWFTAKDFKQIVRYHREGLTKFTGQSFRSILWSMIGSKAFYFGYSLAIPLIFVTSVPWYTFLLAYFIMHFVCGFMLAIIFQPAHVTPDAEFPVPEDNGSVENNWAIHQLLTTANFAPKSLFFSWFVGGLNYQIEHHLFPNVCHVHYKKISKIVRETASEFNLPYHSKKTFAGAVIAHARMLKALGQEKFVPVKA